MKSPSESKKRVGDGEEKAEGAKIKRERETENDDNDNDDDYDDDDDDDGAMFNLGVEASRCICFVRDRRVVQLKETARNPPTRDQ